MTEFYVSPTPGAGWQVWKGDRCVTPNRQLAYEDAVVLCERLNAVVEVPA